MTHYSAFVEIATHSEKFVLAMSTLPVGPMQRTFSPSTRLSRPLGFA
jgi:hypothetical protein